MIRTLDANISYVPATNGFGWWFEELTKASAAMLWWALQRIGPFVCHQASWTRFNFCLPVSSWSHNSPMFLTLHGNFHTFFSPFSLSQPVSGTVQGVVCCTVAPRPPRWVRDGHRDGEEREHLKKFQSPWRIKLPFQSFKGKGLSDLPRRDFLSIAAVKPHREADKQGSAVYRLGN